MCLKTHVTKIQTHLKLVDRIGFKTLQSSSSSHPRTSNRVMLCNWSEYYLDIRIATVLSHTHTRWKCRLYVGMCAMQMVSGCSPCPWTKKKKKKNWYCQQGHKWSEKSRTNWSTHTHVNTEKRQQNPSPVHWNINSKHSFLRFLSIRLTLFSTSSAQ